MLAGGTTATKPTSFFRHLPSQSGSVRTCSTMVSSELLIDVFDGTLKRKYGAKWWTNFPSFLRLPTSLSHKISDLSKFKVGPSLLSGHRGAPCNYNICCNLIHEKLKFRRNAVYTGIDGQLF